MSTAAPAIPLFGDAYLADTRHLSLEEHGAYLQLLMLAWRLPDCALPNDDARLARMLAVTTGRWAKLKPTVMAFWDLTDKGWIQGRLTKERSYVETRRNAQRDKAAAKWESAPPQDDLSPARKRSARLAEAREKGRHTAAEWETMVTMLGNQCVKCRATGVDIVKDHIRPIYLGGSDALNNLQPLCIRCNSSKSSDTTDYRLSVCSDLFERLPNACQTPAPPPPPPVDKKEEVEEAAPPRRAQAEHAPVDQAVEQWNEVAAQVGWPQVQRLSDTRRQATRNRLRTEGIDGWVSALNRARSSPYLGQAPPWFTFDWFVKSANFLKVIEGNYDRSHPANDRTEPTGLGRSARAALTVFGPPN